MDTNQITTLPSLGDFVDEVIAQKHKEDHLTPDMHRDIKTSLLERLNKMITLNTMAVLAPDELVEFEKLVNSKASKEKIQEYVAAHVKNMPQFLAEILAEFRDLYLGSPAASA